MLNTIHTNSKLLKALNDQGAEYLVVGGLAVLNYCPDRGTADDLDLLSNPTPENARKVVAALRQLGRDGLVTYPEKDLERMCRALVTPRTQVPLKIVLYSEILTPIEGFDFRSSLHNSIETTVNGIPVRVIPICDLIGFLEMAMESNDEPADRKKIEQDLALLRQEVRRRFQKPLD